MSASAVQLVPIRRRVISTCIGTRDAAASIANLEQPSLRIACDRQDRMNDEMDDAAAAVNRQADGIDEKRHVVIDDLDDRVRR